MLSIREVQTRAQLRQYIRFPFKLYRDDPFWVPPLLSDEFAYYDPKINANLRENPYQLFLAYHDRTVVGRIMALINLRGNAFLHEKLARWTFLDAIDDEAVVHGLLHAAEAWGQAHGMEHAVGPRGFSDQEPQGALVEGFEERALIATHYNRPEWLHHLETAGYTKDVDWVCYRFQVPKELPTSYQAIYARILKQRHVTCRNFRTKAELKPYILPVLHLLNATYQDLYGFTPLTDREYLALAKKYLPILDPRFVHIIEEDGRLIAFSIVMPDVTAGLQKARGRLLPWGFWHILKAARQSQTLQFLLVGVEKDYRNHGFFALFAVALLQEVHAAGLTTVYSHLQLEYNHHINAWLERLGGKIFRRYRALKKPLT